MTGRPSISIIVVNYNGRAFLERCLQAARAQTFADFDVLVVDNGSTDGSREQAEGFGDPVRVLRLPQNRGFAAANNVGARAVEGDWIALLNNDAFPEPGWLTALAQAAATSAEIGLVASQMVFDARPEMINSTGVCIDRAGVVWDRAGGALADATGPIIPVFGPSAGAALYRRDVWESLGGLREDYFMYLEDVDLAFHARWRGVQSVLAPAAVVRHRYSATIGRASPAKAYWLARNKWLLLARNYPRPYFWRFAPLIAAYDALSLLATGLAGGGAAAWRGRRDGLRLAWAKAASGPARYAAPGRADEVWADLEPLVMPWRAGARYAHLRELGGRVR